MKTSEYTPTFRNKSEQLPVDCFAKEKHSGAPSSPTTSLKWSGRFLTEIEKNRVSLFFYYYKCVFCVFYLSLTEKWINYVLDGLRSCFNGDRWVGLFFLQTGWALPCKSVVLFCASVQKKLPVGPQTKNVAFLFARTTCCIIHKELNCSKNSTLTLKAFWLAFCFSVPVLLDEKLQFYFQW